MTTLKRLSAVLLIAVATSATVWFRPIVNAGQAATPRTSASTGSSATQLADGRWLVLGGDAAGAPSAAAAIVDPISGTTTPLAGGLTTARSGETATLLADGTVLVIGGRTALGALAETAELFDPQSGAFMPIAFEGATVRAGHTATLLPDGRVLVAGGVNASGDGVLDVEMWDPRTQRIETAGRLATARAGHTATLTNDGRVVVSVGVDQNGRARPGAELIDPATAKTSAVETPIDNGEPTRVTGSSPANAATDIPLDVRLVVELSRPLSVASVNTGTVVLHGAEGAVDTMVVPAEGGRLIFVTPRAPLQFDSAYTLAIAGVVDALGVAVVAPPIAFATAKAASTDAGAFDEESWTPDERSRQNGWRSARPPSPWEALPPLMAAPGVTAISGRVLTLDGKPLPRVTLRVEGDADARTDGSGRFLLELHNATSSRRVLQIDGGSASRPTAKYGFFEYGTTVAGGRTNVLPFTIWMPKLDTAHQVTIPSPTTREVVVTTPYIPGLELHLPAGTTITGEDGKPVTTLGITPIPVDRPPFPLAKNVDVPVYFTIQPGGAYVHTAGAGPKGAWLVYPNYTHAFIGKRVQFFHYDPDVNGWYVYGLGTVTPNGQQVMPDPTTRIYTFTGAMINNNPSPPPQAPPPGDCPCSNDGDPVNLATGLFTDEATDLALPDVIPIAVTRTYRQRDLDTRPFGIGMSHAYNLYLWADTNQNYQQADLILPDGARIHYVRTSSGTDFQTAEYLHTTTPTAFYHSTLKWNTATNQWDVALLDGTVYVFGENGPLQAIRDRHGNTVRLSHSNGQDGNLTQVTSPSGRWITFSYGDALNPNRITQVQDNIGRTVSYAYDGAGNLATVTRASTPANLVTSYTYDTNHAMLTVTPPHLQGTGKVLVTNVYTTTADAPTPVGWVKTQTHADGGVYQFAYTFTNGVISQTLVTDPRGKQRQVSFNPNGYVLTDVQALGQTEQQGDSRVRPDASNFVTSYTNTHGDVTSTVYDTLGRVTSVTRLPGQPDEATTTYTYDPTWKSDIATITDPLTHVTTFEYDANGNRKSVIDALSHKIAFTFNQAGQVRSVTDPLQHTTTYGYTGPDLTTVTDALGRITRRFYDGAGRLLSQTDAAGQMTRFTYDPLDHVTQVVDPMGGITAYGHDNPGRLISVTDALTHATTYGYDTMNRLASRTDPLAKTEFFFYDVAGNPSQRIDRKGQITTRSYDALNRLHQITYNDQSTIMYTYDSGNRLRVIDDSLNGTITRDYDALDRLMSEVTAQGTVSYTYDKADRRATMTVQGQPQVVYGYDAANRLTSVTQGSSMVTITHDDANRRSTLTLPNGIVTTYGYDNANQLTDLTYTLGATTLGNLTYSYDAVGNRFAVGGTWARTGIPEALSGATFDAGNRIQTWNGQSMSYDLNGNLTGDGPTSLIWDARDQLGALSGARVAAFTYDGVGRRISRSINGSLMHSLYDGINSIQELSNGSPVANSLTGLAVDELFTRTDSLGSIAFATDALGSIVALTDQSGITQTQYFYQPYGAAVTTGVGNSNPTQFAGRENDRTGLLSYRARYLDPTIGHFVSEDPLGISTGDVNLYRYARGNPISRTDPLGLDVLLCSRPLNGVPGSQLLNLPHVFVFTPLMGGVGFGPKGFNFPGLPDAGKMEREDPFDPNHSLKPGYSCSTVSKNKCVEDCVNDALKNALSNPPPIFKVAPLALGGFQCSDFADQLLNKCNSKCRGQ